MEFPSNCHQRHKAHKRQESNSPSNINIQTMNINLNNAIYSNIDSNNIIPYHAIQAFTDLRTYEKNKTSNHSFHVFPLQTQTRTPTKLNESLNFNREFNRKKQPKAPIQTLYSNNAKPNRCCVSQLINTDLQNPENNYGNYNQTISPQISQLQLERQKNWRLKEQNSCLRQKLNELNRNYLGRRSNLNSRLIAQNSAQRQLTERVVDKNTESAFGKDMNKQNKQLVIRLELMTKQCKVYEDIIQKMQRKIKKLLEQNKRMLKQVQDCSQTSCLLSHLQNQVDGIFMQYQKLQQLIAMQEQQWLAIQGKWQEERDFYLKKIDSLSIDISQNLWNDSDSISRQQTPRIINLKQDIDILAYQSNQERQLNSLPSYQHKQS